MSPKTLLSPDQADAIAQASQLLSPSALYLKLDDEIRVTAYNSVAAVVLEIRSRILGIGGDVQVSRDFLTPSTARAASAQVVSTDEGWLLGGEVIVTGAAPLIGQTYVVVEVVRGLASSGQPYQAIAAGYVTAKVPLAFPGVPIGSPLDGAGALRSITGTTPGAGAEISETVPTGARWQLLAIRANFSTSVAAANRIPALLLDDGVNVYHESGLGLNETASLIYHNNWGSAFGAASVFNLTAIGASLPHPVMMSAGHRMRTSTVAIQAADQWSAVQYLVREWIEGA